LPSKLNPAIPQFGGYDKNDGEESFFAAHASPMFLQQAFGPHTYADLAVRFIQTEEN